MHQEIMGVLLMGVSTESDRWPTWQLIENHLIIQRVCYLLATVSSHILIAPNTT